MLSTETRQESMVKRIGDIVSILMEDRPIFKEDLDYAEMVKVLVNLAQENLTIEDFHTMPDTELKERCEGVMSIEILSKIGENFTPEQMAIFDEAIKRK